MASAPRSDDLLELLTAPRVDLYALLELALEWDGVVGAEAQLAAALRLFVITRDPLDWLAGRGSAWATSNADGDALELPVYVARDEVQRRVEANEGDLVAALGRLGETAVIAAARCQGIIFAGAIQRARTSNPAGWRAIGKGAARLGGVPEPAGNPVPQRRRTPPGRNGPCPCGSGRKHKHCCGQ